MPSYILAHDIGTTGNKAVLYSSEGELIVSSFCGYDTYYAKQLRVEQNPEKWWEAVCISTKEIIRKSHIDAAEIACVTFSGQMMGVVPVDQSGNVLRQAMIWADMRAEKEIQQLRHHFAEKQFYQITGNRLSPSYSGAKMKWLQNNEKSIHKQTFKYLQAKDYLILKLTGMFATDLSDASGTNLLDIHTKYWSAEIIDAWEMDAMKLPDLYSSTTIIGEVTRRASKETGLKSGTPVVMGGADGSCAAVGAGAVEAGDAFNYLGSSSWISICRDTPLLDKERRTFNFIHLDEQKYLPTGTMQAAGSSFQWIRNQLYTSTETSSQEIYQKMNEEMKSSQPGANGLIFLPYLLGERSPIWDANAKGAFIGMSMSHHRGDIIRAVIEGVSLNLNKILQAFVETGQPIEEMWLFGGGAKSEIWRQLLADVYGVNIRVPKSLDETTSKGAAIAGGIAVGLLKDFSEAKKWINQRQLHRPNLQHHQFYQKLSPIFTKAYKQLSDINNELGNL